MLRTTLGALAVAFAASELSGVIERTPVVWSLAFLLVLGGSGLILGFLTPLASGVVAICALATNFPFLPRPPLASMSSAVVSLLMVVIAIAISLLGPGAFSVDGHLFGRREIVIPPRTPEI